MENKTNNNVKAEVKEEAYVITSDGRRVKYSEWLEERKAEMDW